MKQKFFVSAVALILAFLCVSIASAEDLKGEITMWAWNGDSLKKWVLPVFNEEYPDIKVNIVTIPSEEVHQKMLACLAAGAGAPDVSLMQGDEIQKFIHYGGLTDLTDLISPHKNDFPIYKIVNNTGPDGRIYGVPFDCGPVAMYYRADVFNELGITVPIDTWNDYIQVGNKLKSKGYYLHRLTSAGGEEALFRIFTQQQGASYFNLEGEATLNTEASVNALTLMRTILEEGLAKEVQEWTPPYVEAVVGDEIATIVSAAWYMHVFHHSFGERAKGNKWQIAPLPVFKAGDARTSNLGGSEVVIPDQSKKKELAWKFVEFTCATVEGKKAHVELGEFPAYLPVFRDPEIYGKTHPFFGTQEVYKLFADLLPEVPPFYSSPALPEVMVMINAELPNILSGKVSIADGISTMQKEAEEIVRHYK